MLGCILVFGLVLGCGDNPVQPAVNDLASVPRAEVATSLEGCARLRVTVGRGSQVSVDLTDSSCDGLALAVVGRPAFDRATQRVRLPLALVNRSGRAIRAPAMLYARPADFTVIAPPGLAGKKHAAEYLSFTNPDSVVTEAADSMAGATIFRLDSLLTPAGQPPRLASGDTSRARWVEITLKQGVEVFEAVFHARATPARPPVPAVSPDTVPRSVFDTTNYGPPSSCMGGAYIRNLILIVFRPGSSQPQRQAAIDAIDGEVVGGDRLYGDDGYYYVKIPDDATGESLCRAMKTLDTVPQVEVSGPMDWNFGPEYLKPKDGPGWREWVLNPDSAQGAQWGLEAIDAPMAWGCSSGSSSVRVAVVDVGFHSIEELTRNVQTSSGMDAQPLEEHGTEVAGILAAAGNDGDGITGTLWRARLGLYEAALDRSGSPTQDSSGHATLSPTQISTAIDTAVAGGATVINLSLGMKWARLERQGIRRNTARGEAVLQSEYRHLWESINRIPPSSRPLIVVAAGNDTTDARWAAIPLLEQDFPASTLVVGAASHYAAGQFTRWAASNTGSLVQIAAPGEVVGTLDSLGRPVVESGTSMAAPYVAGVAAMLMSFDSISPATAKQYILDGAQRGGRTAGGAPLLNAYEALRVAAEQPGAPLCGNAVWAISTDAVPTAATYTRVYAERDSGAEPLFATPPGVTGGALGVAHGGHAIDLAAFPNTLGFTYAREPSGKGVWSPSSRVDSVAAGSYRSTLGRSHGNDTLVVMRGDQIAGTYGLYMHTLPMGWVPLSDYTLVGTGSLYVPPSNLTKASWCEGSYDCYSVGSASGLSWFPLFLPTGGEAMSVVSRNRGEQSTWCDSSGDCFPIDDNSSDYSEVRAWDLSTGSNTLVTSISGLIWSAALSEDGRSLLLLGGPYHEYETTPHSPWVFADHCRVKLLDLRTHQLQDLTGDLPRCTGNVVFAP